MIHVFGDSHVSTFSGVDGAKMGFPDPKDCLKPFRTYYVSTLIAYTFLDHVKSFIEWINKFQVERMVICAGEIDIRVWLNKKADDKGISLNTVVDNTVYRYCEGINKIKGLVKELIIFAPHPQRCNNHGKLVDFPSYGTYERMYEAGYLFNSYLEYYVPDSVKVFSVFNKMMSLEMNKNSKFYLDDIHLRSSTTINMLVEEMNSKGVKCQL